MNGDSTKPEFWDPRYKSRDMPWDSGGVPESLDQFLWQTHAVGRVLIPGCGSAYEVRAFDEAGWEVAAVDFSAEAVARAQKMLGALGDRVMLADFFAFEPKGSFDLVYEKNFLCALPPDLWPQYAARMAELIRPGGSLAGIFFHGHEEKPPPYPITDEQAELLFDGEFDQIEDEPLQEGNRWQVWVRRFPS